MRKILFIFLSLSSPAMADLNTVTLGNVSGATGSAGIATVEPGDSAFLNPATLVHLKGYQITTSAKSSSEKDGVGNSQALMTITDNGFDAMVPASIAFIHREDYTKNTTLKSRGLKVAMSNFLVPQVSMGLTVSHWMADVGGEHPAETNADLGFLYTPNGDVGVGLVGYNLIPTRKTVLHSILGNANWGAGFNYIYQGFIRLRLDFLGGPAEAPNKYTYQGGFESYLSDWFVMRFGAQRDDFLRKNRLTAGAGFNGPKFQVNYAYQMSPQDDSLSTHGVDLVIPF